MAGCVLFASGELFQVDSFLKSSSLRKIAKSFHKGEESGSKRHYQVSGFEIEITEPEADLEKQLKGAIRFLEKYESDLKILQRSDVEEIELRFGGWWYSNTAAFMFSVPPKLSLYTGKLGITLSIAVYGTNED